MKSIKLKLQLLLLLIFISTAINLNAQISALGFNYQGVYRDNLGAVQKNTSVSVNFIIYKSSVSSGNLVYSENQIGTTDDFGVFNMIIGKGTSANSTKFSDIDWSAAGAQYFVKIQMVISGTPTDIATMQLNAVPYAKASAVSETSLSTKIIDTTGIKNGDLLKYNDASKTFSRYSNPWDNYYIIEERKTAGVNGGNSVAGWQKRALNTTVDNEGTAITFDATNSQFSLSPGKYYVEGYTTSAGHNLRLTSMVFNTSDNSPAIYGSSAQTTNSTTGSTGAYSYSITFVQGFITVTGTQAKTYEFQLYNDAASNYIGLGTSDYAAAYKGASTFKPEIYSHLFIQKIK